MSLVNEYSKDLSRAEKTYFRRAAQEETRIPQLYGMPKLHKQPLKSRPVVSCVNSSPEFYSKWLDNKMEEMLCLTDFKLRDSYQVLEEVRRGNTFPPGTKLFTMDATAMYTNIPPDHGIEIMGKWIDEFGDELEPNFPRDLFLAVLETVLKNNVFQFGDTFWHQEKGTAMGTSTACKYATLYFAYHERTLIWPRYKQYLPYYKRFIDDVFGGWNSHSPGSSTAWQEFIHDMNAFGILKWKLEAHGNEVNFLDLTIQLSPQGRVETRTYQKPMHLHLYIPPSSAHPPGMTQRASSEHPTQILAAEQQA